MNPHQYSTAGAFRTALEIRLLDRSRREGVDLQRLRRQVAFDRLLARLFSPSRRSLNRWVLKGGYALEMRFHEARSTRDLDFTIPGQRAAVADLRAQLQYAVSLLASDFFAFVVGEPIATLDQAPEGGARFPVDARLDGRTFVTFHVDLGVGDEVLEPLDDLVGEDWLAFAGIPPAVAPALSKEQHWAEKLHSYTLPRVGAANSRVRDLVDLVFLLKRGRLSPERVRRAAQATFDRRKTHAMPEELPAPPAEWARPFAALATECGLDIAIDSAFELVLAFWRNMRGLK